MFGFANISFRGSVNRIIRKYQARCFPRGSQYSGDFHMSKGIQILFVGLLLSLLFTLPGYTENSKTTFVIELRSGKSLHCSSVEKRKFDVVCTIGKNMTVTVNNADIKSITTLDGKPFYALSLLPSGKDPDEKTSSPSNGEVSSSKTSRILKKYENQFQRAKKQLEHSLQKEKAEEELGMFALMIARFAFQFGDLNRAEKWLEEATKWLRNPWEVEYVRAQMAFFEKRFPDALFFIQKARSHAPQRSEIFLLHARILEKMDRLNDALVVLQEGLQYPHSKEYERFYGELQIRQLLMRDYVTFETRHFRIRVHRELSRKVLNRIRDLLETLYREVTAFTRLHALDPIPVRIYSNADYRSLTESPGWSIGLYDGIVHVNTLGATEKIDRELMRNIRHELCHAILTQVTSNRAPPWLQEGFAERCEWLDMPEHVKKTKKSLPSAHLPAPDHFFSVFYTSLDANRVRLYYRVAFVFVQFLIDRYGYDRLLNFFESLPSVTHWSQAFVQVYGREPWAVYDQMQIEFRLRSE